MIDDFLIEIAVQTLSHGPWAPAWARLACRRCNDHVVVWTSADPPTLGELDRAADHHRENDCRPVR